MHLLQFSHFPPVFLLALDTSPTLLWLVSPRSLPCALRDVLEAWLYQVTSQPTAPASRRWLQNEMCCAVSGRALLGLVLSGSVALTRHCCCLGCAGVGEQETAPRGRAGRPWVELTSHGQGQGGEDCCDQEQYSARGDPAGPAHRAWLPFVDQTPKCPCARLALSSHPLSAGLQDSPGLGGARGGLGALAGLKLIRESFLAATTGRCRPCLWEGAGAAPGAPGEQG